MRALWRLKPSAALHSLRFPKGIRCIAADSRVFQEGDYVLLREVHDKHLIFTKPLEQGKAIHSHHGYLSHSDIIGKRVREIVQFSKGVKMRIHEPTLDEYVRYTSRLVTPIYPADANVIVQLLDLHPRNAQNSGHSRLEVLEAGTGHAGLTLHLARAIHAANGTAPTLHSDEAEELRRWRESRQAVIHTIDIKAQYSKHADNVVRGFRRGLYSGDIDFQIGNVSEFLQTQFSARENSEPFLSAAVLDLPSAEDHLDSVSRALRVDGKLVVFNPSITQIADCVKRIRNERLPLVLEKVVELGPGMSAGREWDVRVATVRARHAKQTEEPSNDEVVTSENGEKKKDEGYKSEETEGADSTVPVNEPVEQGTGDEYSRNWAMVCRPKVGKVTIGGGFVGLWSKMRTDV